MKTQTAYITLQGLDFEVEFTVDGKYIPETRYEPAEYPEIYITSIKSDDDLIDLFTSNLISLEDIEMKIAEEM